MFTAAKKIVKEKGAVANELEEETAKAARAVVADGVCPKLESLARSSLRRHVMQVVGAAFSS